MRRKILSLFVILISVSIFMFSCGGSGTTSTPPPTPAATCDQNCQDKFIASATISLVTFLYNQNFAGSPVGPKNTTVNCPQGGSVHITGSTAIDTNTNINTLHLVYDMTGCQYQTANYNLTFTGSIAEDGTFESLPGTFIAMTYLSPTGSTLTYTGTVSSSAPTTVNGNCAIAMSRNQAGSSSETVNGTICGRSVSY